MKETIEQERLRVAYDYVMDTYQGRQFAYELLAESGVFRPAPNDVNLMLINEGKRRFGLELMFNLETRNTEKYFLMLKEGKQRNKEKEDGEHRDNDDERIRESIGLEDGGSANLPSFDNSRIPI